MKKIRTGTFRCSHIYIFQKINYIEDQRTTTEQIQLSVPEFFVLEFL